MKESYFMLTRLAFNYSDENRIHEESVKRLKEDPNKEAVIDQLNGIISKNTIRINQIKEYSKIMDLVITLDSLYDGRRKATTPEQAQKFDEKIRDFDNQHSEIFSTKIYHDIYEMDKEFYKIMKESYPISFMLPETFKKEVESGKYKDADGNEVDYVIGPDGKEINKDEEKKDENQIVKDGEVNFILKDNPDKNGDNQNANKEDDNKKDENKQDDKNKSIVVHNNPEKNQNNNGNSDNDSNGNNGDNADNQDDEDNKKDNQTDNNQGTDSSNSGSNQDDKDDKNNKKDNQTDNNQGTDSSDSGSNQDDKDDKNNKKNNQTNNNPGNDSTAQGSNQDDKDDKKNPNGDNSDLDDDYNNNLGSDIKNGLAVVNNKDKNDENIIDADFREVEEKSHLFKKALWAAGGFVTGVGLSCVPGVGTIRMAVASAKLAQSAINLWSKKYPNGKIASLHKLPAKIKEKYPNIASKIEFIESSLKKTPLNLFVNGMAVGYLAGNIFEMVSGNTVFDAIKDAVQQKPDVVPPPNVTTTTVRTEPVQQLQPNTNVDISQSVDTPVDTVVPTPNVDVVQGQSYDLSSLTHGMVSSDANNSVHLLTNAGKNATFDKEVILPNGTKMWHFKQANGLGYAWFRADDVQEVLNAAAEAGMSR